MFNWRLFEKCVSQKRVDWKDRLRFVIVDTYLYNGIASYTKRTDSDFHLRSPFQWIQAILRKEAKVMFILKE